MWEKAGDKPKTGKLVVIADDNKEICELVVDILQHDGHVVDMVHDGYQLLAYLEKKNPAVIILDLMMPEKSGLSILSTIRQIAPYSRIIIYSGYEEYQHSVYGRSADRFLVKGSDIEKLIEAVNELA
ncbi:MAG: response regulator [Candidatus Omnitrophica bacterium]|nr:response regulator [Candidatus Omnitrophota bacterium]